MNDRQRPSIAIGPFAAYLERTGVEQNDQSVARSYGQSALIIAFAVQFRRIDVLQANLLAFQPNGIAIMDAMIAGAGRANGKGEGKQQHRLGVAHTHEAYFRRLRVVRKPQEQNVFPHDAEAVFA